MRQSWRDLLFLHFPCDPAEIAPLLPADLTPDVFPNRDGNERAWIGFVPFQMKDVRWSFAPRVSGTHTFPETNVRTYVHRGGRDPGVWFFSLDAANRLAVGTARVAFGLPYFHSRMSILREEDRIDYRGVRGAESYSLSGTIGSLLPLPRPGTLEFFLLERYLLYTDRRGRLLSGRVHHRPYELRDVRMDREEETLVQASGVSPRPFLHRVFSEGVDVDVFSLRSIG